MSETVFPPAAASDLDELSRVAAAWIERRDFGEWNAQDQAQFEEWLGASPANRIAYLRMEAGWKRTELLGALRPFNGEERPRKTSSFPRALLMKIAAAAIFVTALGAGGTYYFAPHPQSFVTGVGGRQTLRLSDGTLIDMNTDTRIELSGARGERKVWLEKGEAYFQVHHDPRNPFVVIAGNRRITDLGTEFLVRSDPGRLEVALVEGRARYESSKSENAKSLTLTPGDVVVATPHSLALSEKSQTYLSTLLGWRRGVLIFQHTTLAEAVAEFNRYNNQKIVLADASVAQRTIGGAFTITDVHRFAVILRDALGLKVQNRNGEIVISQ